MHSDIVGAPLQVSPENSAPGAVASRRLPVWLIPALLLSAFVAQSFWFIATQSLTYDEPAHIIAGMDAWQHGRFEHWNDHPPLGRLWLSLPVATTHAHFAWQQLPSGFRVDAMRPGPEWFAWRIRPMNTLLGVALGIALWFAARRIFSEGAANVAMALFAFTPSLIAHYSVATTDGVGALFVFLTAFQLVRWRRNPNWKQTSLFGLALGGLLLAKFYAPPLVLLALGLMLVLKPGSGFVAPSQWTWSAAASAAVIMLVMLWAGYSFHVSHLRIGDGQVRVSYPNRPERVLATQSHARVNVIVPAGEFFEGFREVALSNRRGRPAWFLGKIYPSGGIRLYYPVAMAMKWTPVLLGTALLGIVLVFTRKWPRRGDLVVMCLFAVVYFAFAIQSKYDIGERHILPLYPFALLFAGRLWEYARQSRVFAAILILALLVNAADCLRSAPDYLAYFTPFVSAQNRWRLLTDSNLDWGQGLIAVRNYERSHTDEQIRLAYFGSIDPVLYGVKAPPFAPGERSTGILVLGASCLSGQVLDDREAYRWLWDYKPKRILDGSMWLYNVEGSSVTP